MLFKNFSQFAILSIMYDDFSKNWRNGHLVG